MAVDTVDLDRARPGDVVRCVSTRLGSVGWPNDRLVTHLCLVDHRYGPHEERLFVRPLCGNPAGRALPEADGSGEFCGRCRVIEAKGWWRR